jgi:hypothetical protein
MNISNSSYTDETNNHIKATIDGIEVVVPVDNANRHYQAIVNSGVSIAAYVAPDITIDAVRAHRDKLLQESDAWLLQDFPTGAATEQQILDYRQALRDLTVGLDLNGVKSIDDVTFPTKPF